MSHCLSNVTAVLSPVLAAGAAAGFDPAMSTIYNICFWFWQEVSLSIAIAQLGAGIFRAPTFDEPPERVTAAFAELVPVRPNSPAKGDGH